MSETTKPEWAVSGTPAGKRINCVFIAAGDWHDIDYPRLEILKLLSQDERVRTRVFEDYSNIEATKNADLLITYTCNVVPSLSEQEALREWVAQGGRWLALHGTASVLRFTADGEVDSPKWAPHFMETLGTQFIAHPPIASFRVEVADDADPLVAGIGDFDVVDELYLSDIEAPALQTLLKTSFEGEATGFVRRNWGAAEHPVMYRRALDKGEIVYLTLGHCRGHYDMQPLVEYWPNVQMCAWESPQYTEILGRCVKWAIGNE
jgi:uncharacterized protein